jgi:hypothetical protein
MLALRRRGIYAAADADCLGGFNEMSLALTGPQSAHSKLWTARSGRLGCSSMTAIFIGLRQFGQISSTTNVRGMVSSFRARRNRTLKGSNVGCKGLGALRTAPRKGKAAPDPVTCRGRRTGIVQKFSVIYRSDYSTTNRGTSIS